MSGAHTPTPWSLSERFPEILGAPDTGVIVARIPEWGVSADRPDEGSFNAAHIVRCVNAHDVLVAALKQIVAETNSSYHAYDLAVSALAKAGVA